jgi:hypothetical protein
MIAQQSLHPASFSAGIFCELCELVHTPATTPSVTDNTWITLLAREGQMLHRGIAAGLAVVGLCLGPAVLASTVLAQEQPSAQVFQTWRTTTLGTYKSVDAYRRALDSARIRIGDAADEILGRPVFPYTRTKTVVELAVLSAAELGVESDESSLADVYERARRAGLELCPPEVGPQLRLDYRNQPLGEALDIAMEPVATYSGDPTILTLANWGTGLVLIGRDGRSESKVNRISRFVFALPTNGRLEAMREPQIVPTSSEQTNQAPKGGL